MIDNALLSFSFFQGVFAFFAPCAVSLLPGYLSAFVTKDVHPDKHTTILLLRRALLFALSTVLGIITIYGIATALILSFREFIKSAIVYIAIGLGGLIVIVGIFMLFNKTLSFSFKSSSLRSKNQLIESYLFGVAYGVGVLGCLFPFFLAVAVSALQAPSVFVGSTYLIAYITGMSLLMVLFYVLAQFAQEFLRKSLRKVLPYINRVGGVLVIAAGIYIIWYQSALL